MVCRFFSYKIGRIGEPLLADVISIYKVFIYIVSSERCGENKNAGKSKKNLFHALTPPSL
jgi:hypothetical protein